jgi:hypothetical protein
VAWGKTQRTITLFSIGEQVRREKPLAFGGGQNVKWPRLLGGACDKVLTVSATQETAQLYNLKTGASLVSAKTVDVLTFIPLIPAIPVIALWFLPWENWIPKIIPKTIIGPHLLYCAFAIWHFKQPWWTVLLVGLMGIAISAAAIFELRKARTLKQARERKARMLEQARDWPVAEGFVLRNGQSRDAGGLLKVTLSYMYKVNGKEFFGGESFTFTSEDDAERFESKCRERKLKVHF